jgi:RNase P/RNase MRP subunit POP5
MAVKPTARLKKRYVKFTLKGDFTEEELSRALYKYSLRFFGEYGLSSRTIKLIEFNGKEGIILTDRQGANEILGMLALIDSLEGKPARLIPAITSGTLASMKRKSPPGLAG